MIPTLGLVLGSPLLHPEPCQHWVPHAYSIREQMGLRKVSFPVRPAREPSSSGRCQSTSEGFGPGSNLRFSGWWWLRWQHRAEALGHPPSLHPAVHAHLRKGSAH